MVKVSECVWDRRYLSVEDLDRDGRSLGTVRFIRKDSVRWILVVFVLPNGVIIVFVWPMLLEW